MSTKGHRPDCALRGGLYFCQTMNTAWLTPESRALLAGPSLKINIVIIYEDAESGRRAKRFSDKLLRELGEQFRCARNLWSFDVLAITDVRNAAAGVGQPPTWLSSPASGERELAPQVEQWLDLWAWLIDGTSPALVALFGNGDGGCAQKIRGVLCAGAGQTAGVLPANNFRCECERASRCRTQAPCQLQSLAFQLTEAGGAGTMAAQHGGRPRLRRRAIRKWHIEAGGVLLRQQNPVGHGQASGYPSWDGGVTLIGRENENEPHRISRGRWKNRLSQRRGKKTQTAGKGVYMNLLSQMESTSSHALGSVQTTGQLRARARWLLGRTLEIPFDTGEPVIMADWEPLTDLIEDDKEFLVKVEAPRDEEGGCESDG